MNRFLLAARKAGGYSPPTSGGGGDYNLRLNGALSSAGSAAAVIWNPVEQARDYKRQYRVQGSSTWLDQVGLVSDWEEYTYVDLAPSTIYELRVASISEDAVVGAYSTPLTITTPASTGVLWEEDFRIGKGSVLGPVNLAVRIPDVSNAEGHRWVVLAQNGSIGINDDSIAKFFLEVGMYHANTARKAFTFQATMGWGPGPTVMLCVRDTGGKKAGSCEPTDAYAVTVDTVNGSYQTKRYIGGNTTNIASGNFTVDSGVYPHVIRVVMNNSDMAQLVFDGANIGAPFAITGSSWGCSLRSTGEQRVDNIKAF